MNRKKMFVILFAFFISVVSFAIYFFSDRSFTVTNKSTTIAVEKTPETTLTNELPKLIEGTPFINIFFVEFDNSKTYTIWLYRKKEPNKREIESFIKSLAPKLEEKSPGYSFNFHIFPENSMKRPNDQNVYDSLSVSWRNHKVVFPVDN